MLTSSAFLRLSLVTLAVAIHGIITVPVVNEEVMGFAQVSESVVRSLSDDPNSIDVQIDAFGETRNVRLVPNINDVFARDFSGYIADLKNNGVVVIQKIVTTQTEPDDIHSKLYTDRTGRASLYVERRQGQITLEGILDHDTRIECFTSRQERSIYKPVVHVVYRRTKNLQGTCLSIVPNITGPTSTDEHKVETRGLPALIQPEVLVVMDYQTSKFHNFNLDAAKKYLGIYFNSVNRRYASIASPQIQNVITAVLLTNSEAIQNFIVYGSKPILDAGATLEGFGKWVTKQTSIKSNYDIAVWMTALDLGMMNNGKWSNQNVGVAYIGGACTKNFNVGLGEDKPGSYYGIHTHSHEIAHLYGSAHDGEKVDNPKGNPGALNCPAKNGYIMTYQFGTKNRFFFSSCSINQMKYTMGSNSASCLLNVPKANAVKLVATLPGTIKSLDDQCSSIYGSGYKFYESKLSEVCVKMWCAPATSGFSIILSSQGPALEGSRCGTGMNCINGECKKK